MTPSRETGRQVVIALVLGVAIVLALLFVAERNPASAASHSRVVRTGIVHGIVTAGPTCPVEQSGANCTRPVEATIDARSAAGSTVGWTRSDASGRYLIRLSPGDYTLFVVTDSRWPRCPEKPVTVRFDRGTRADIACDTGIR